jgi:serine protease AprX
MASTRRLAGLTAGALVACGPILLCVPATSSPPPARQAVSAARSGAPDFADSKWGDAYADAIARDLSGSNSAKQDPGSLYTIDEAIGARAVWGEKDATGRNITGQGVTVALLDSGTAVVPALTWPGKLSYGPDLSTEGGGPLDDQDTFGHGTFMAGLIAARGVSVNIGKDLSSLGSTPQLGVAPDAGLLSIKLAQTDGGSDVSQVIAGLNWVTEHTTDPKGNRVRVINLSFGTESVQPYDLDPLAAAAENAWRHGIVVVVSGGNAGPGANQLTDPAIDPYVLAVGASDSRESVDGWKKPTVASFSSSGTPARHVDILAPGTSVVSLRAPGSYVDRNHPEGRVAGDVSGQLFRGSGTSQAAAVVSGAVALLLQSNPNLTPDQVKALLVSTATPVPAEPVLAGAGQLDVAAAVDVARSAQKNGGVLPAAIQAGSTQSYPTSTGQGSLEAARGGAGLVDGNGVPVNGEADVRGQSWNPAAWWDAASNLRSWNGGDWLGSPWTGDRWVVDPSGLGTSRWSASPWSASRWSASRWSASRWSASRWSASRWSSDDWE